MDFYHSYKKVIKTPDKLDKREGEGATGLPLLRKGAEREGEYKVDCAKDLAFAVAEVLGNHENGPERRQRVR